MAEVIIPLEDAFVEIVSVQIGSDFDRTCTRNGYWEKVPDYNRNFIPGAIRLPIGIMFPDDRGWSDNPSLQAVMNGDWSGVNRRSCT